MLELKSTPVSNKKSRALSFSRWCMKVEKRRGCHLLMARMLTLRILKVKSHLRRMHGDSVASSFPLGSHPERETIRCGARRSRLLLTWV